MSLEVGSDIFCVVCIWFFVQSSSCYGQNLQDQTDIVNAVTVMKPLAVQQSCRYTCGLHRRGCSCQRRCLVFRNCCEDFHRHCSNMHAEATEQYRGLLPIEVPSCVKEGVFLITSCPSHNIKRNNASIESSANTFEKIIPTSKDIETLLPRDRRCWVSALDLFRSMQRLAEDAAFNTSTVGETKVPLVLVLKAFSRLYVSDRLTGLVYASLDVFACHATSKSVPCLWRLYTPSGETTPLNLIRAHSVRDLFFYAPPRLVPEKMTPRCTPNVRDDCHENSSFFTKYLSEKCQAFTSVVQENRFPFKIFKNRYCLECIKGYKSLEGIRPVDRQRDSHSLSGVLMTMQRNSISLVSEKMGKFQDWQSAECSLVPNIPCEISQCTGNATKRPDGKCKNYYTLHIAVPLMTSPSTQTHQRLAKLLQCMAGKQLDLDLDSEAPPRLTVYHLEKGIKLFGVGIGVYSTFHGVDMRKFLDFALNYAPSILQAINGWNLPANVTRKSTYELQDVDIFLKNSERDKVTFSSETNINRMIYFCIGMDFKEQNFNISLGCYSQLSAMATQANHSCFTSYLSTSSNSHSISYTSLFHISLNIIALIASQL